MNYLIYLSILSAVFALLVHCRDIRIDMMIVYHEYMLLFLGDRLCCIVGIFSCWLRKDRFLRNMLKNRVICLLMRIYLNIIYNFSNFSQQRISEILNEFTII